MREYIKTHLVVLFWLYVLASFIFMFGYYVGKAQQRSELRPELSNSQCVIELTPETLNALLLLVSPVCPKSEDTE
jgi:hypothetical protein